MRKLSGRKIFGWILLSLGILMIFWGIWQSYQIFSAKKPVPEIFRIEKSSEKSTVLSGEKTEEQIQQVIKEQFEKMLPPGFLPKLFNLASWSIFIFIIFIFILIYGGGKLSILGIKLLK
ncbi:MAG: hypothetical protein QMC93_00020 [Patescibacteria group bacterium]|nr:hypothetical protein [Patescibacteria group bacterium]